MMRRMQRKASLALTAMLALAALVNAALGVTSYWLYTSGGFDFEWATDQGRILECFARIRWDGGSIWIGVADVVHLPHRGQLDWFDPGGSIFKPTEPKEPQSLANRAGFWLVWFDAADTNTIMREQGTLSSRMIGVPWWLVLIALGPLFAWRARRHWRNREAKRRLISSADFVPA